MNKRRVRREVCQKKANEFEKGNKRQAITEKGDAGVEEGEKEDKEQNNKMDGGKVGTARQDKQSFPKK